MIRWEKNTLKYIQNLWDYSTIQAGKGSPRAQENESHGWRVSSSCAIPPQRFIALSQNFAPAEVLLGVPTWLCFVFVFCAFLSRNSSLEGGTWLSLSCSCNSTKVLFFSWPSSQRFIVLKREFSREDFQVWQYPVFALMGIICGLIGPFYVNFRLNMLKVGFN